MLVVKVMKPLIKAALNSFLASMSFLGFMSIEFGVNMMYPGICLAFFGQLLELLNFDLLSEYSAFDIPYEPEQSMADPYNDNFGQIGFESCSITLNLGSVPWLMLFYSGFVVTLGAALRPVV